MGIGFQLSLCLSPFSTAAQSQFQKGWTLYVEGAQGISTNFTSSPDLYVGGLDLKPMVTVIPDHLRLGASAGFIYSNNSLDGTIGPLLAWKLKTFTIPDFGSFGNLQLQLGALWGGAGHSLVGGGPYVELARRFQIGLTAYRDYGVNDWWFRIGLGVNLTPKKIALDPTLP